MKYLWIIAVFAALTGIGIIYAHPPAVPFDELSQRRQRRQGEAAQDALDRANRAYNTAFDAAKASGTYQARRAEFQRAYDLLDDAQFKFDAGDCGGAMETLKSFFLKGTEYHGIKSPQS